MGVNFQESASRPAPTFLCKDHLLSFLNDRADDSSIHRGTHRILESTWSTTRSAALYIVHLSPFMSSFGICFLDFLFSAKKKKDFDDFPVLV